MVFAAGFAMYNCCDNYRSCYSLIVLFHYNYASPLSPSLEEKPELMMVYNSQLFKASLQFATVPEEGNCFN
jgi:hypothetical protein